MRLCTREPHNVVLNNVGRRSRFLGTMQERREGFWKLPNGNLHILCRHGTYAANISQPYPSKHHNTKRLSSGAHLVARVLIDRHRMKPLAHLAPHLEELDMHALRGWRRGCLRDRLRVPIFGNSSLLFNTIALIHNANMLLTLCRQTQNPRRAHTLCSCSVGL